MVKGLTETAVNLPWLAPRAASLVALAGAPCASVWNQIRSDPGCLLLFVRHARPLELQSSVESLPFNIAETELLEAACGILRSLSTGEPTATGFVDWGQGNAASLYRAVLHYAAAARLLADRSGRCHPELAWVAGLLAPLGHLALAAADNPQSAVRNPQSVARRLNQRWRLPSWLAAITGYLALPADIATALGAESDLFRLVQLAAALVDEQPGGLNLTAGLSPAVLSRKLDLNPGLVADWLHEIPTHDITAEGWEDPSRIALLPELLDAAAKRRRLEEVAGGELVQRHLDVLLDAALRAQNDESDDLRQQKLIALAEFAAGAAHEINNPLAVISGNAQYLLNRETDLERRETLQKIIKQTQRIHNILTDVLLFARPALPKKQPADAGAIIREVADSLRAFAEERKVTLQLAEPAAPVLLHVDREQVCRALTALLRNAIEAAPEGGWAAVRIETPSSDAIHFVVEDSGPGPNPAHRDSLFDPFFSGRNAGRGRGLGLPIAWRLARLHEGDVFLADSAPGPTRFVLSLPLPPVSLSPQPLRPEASPIALSAAG